jgi:C-terminal processing protease CtpA/Prc
VVRTHCRGDIVIKVDGKKVVNGIPDVLGCIGLEVGKSISFEIKRGSGIDKTLTVVTSPDKSLMKSKGLAGRHK